MRPTAVRGAIGFLTRLPVGRDEAAWTAFRRTPATLPLVGYLVGVALAGPVGVPVPPATRALSYVLAVLAVTGIAHLDGAADAGDAAATHGSPAERRAVARDAAVGVGGAAAVGTVLLGLALAVLALAGRPPLAVAGLVVAAEVAAKFAVTVATALGSPSHEGMGAAVVVEVRRRDLVGPAAVALPAAALGVRLPTPLLSVPVGAVALLAGVVAALAVRRWAAARLGGVGGDALGATHELARLAALHVGVAAWTLS